MGTERNGYRLYFFLYITFILCVVLTVSGCTGLERLIEPNGELKTAERLMAENKFEAAQSMCDRALKWNSASGGARALFLSAMIYAHPENPAADLERAMDRLDRLVRNYPQSRLVQNAKVFIGLLASLDQSHETIMRLSQEKQKEHQNLRLVEGKSDKLLQRIEQLERIELRAAKEEIEQLKQQIEQLKQIDLEMEKKKKDVLQDEKTTVPIQKSD